MEYEGEGYNVRYYCPSCFYRWSDTLKEEPDENWNENVKCSFCLEQPSSLNLLKRRLENLDGSYMSDFPLIIRHIVKHINLLE